MLDANLGVVVEYLLLLALPVDIMSDDLQTDLSELYKMRETAVRTLLATLSVTVVASSCMDD